MTKAGLSRKFWAFLLALLMVVTMLPLTAFAEGEPQEPADTSQPVETAQPAEAPLLSGLSVKYGDLELLAGFSKDNFTYSIDLGAEAEKVVITAAPEAESDTVSGTGEVTLITGENILQVTVSRTAQGGDPLTQEYVITINRAAKAEPGDCSLASLKVLAGETELVLDPAFSPEVTEYKIATDALSVNVEAAANGTGAKVEGTGPRDLAEGDNVLKVTVTAAEGAVKEYNITITASSGVSAEAVSDYTFFVSGGKATITGYRGPGGKIITPTMYGTRPVTAIGACAFSGSYNVTGITISSGVTSIGEYAFSGNMSVETVTLPASLTSIGASAFYYSGITGISIPKNVSSIGAEAFRDCSSLAAINVDPLNAKFSSANGVLFNKDRTKLIQYPAGKSGTLYTVPNGAALIGDYAFENSRLKSVVIPGGVTEIGVQAFNGCSRLESINIPDGVTAIGESAFYACPKLKGINIPASVQSIGLQAFFECLSLESINVDALNTVYASEDGVLFNNDKKMLIQYPAGKSGISYSIPGTTETIGENAFAYSALRDITIPGSVTSVETQAFYWCGNLYSIEIPDSVANMDRSFASCRELTDVVFMGSCPEGDSDDFIDCGALTIYYKTGNTGFPSDWNGHTVVAFDPNEGHTLTYEGNGAEEGSAPAGGTYKYGDPVTMPASGGLVKQPYDFSGWNVVASSAGIGYAAGETYRMSPHDVTLYADWQTGCKLKSLKVYYDNGDYGYGLSLNPAFNPDVLEYTVEVSNNVDRVYVNAEAAFAGDGVVEDYDYTLEVGENDIYITVSSEDGSERTYTITVTRLPATGEKTFGYYKYKDEGDYIRITKYSGKEADVIVPGTIDFKPVVKIGMDAFKGNNYIQSVALPGGVTDIDAAAFKYCLYLRSVALPGTLKNIGSEAFFNCMRLNSVTLPGSLVSIGPSAFSYCYALTDFTIPAGVAEIGEPFLAGCEGISTISAGSNPNFTVRDGVLFNFAETRLIRYPAKKSGTSYIVPPTVKEIDETAFDSAQVGSVVISEGVTVLDYNTFADCENLASVTLPDSLKEISSCAFYNCPSLTGVMIPKNVYSVYGDAFIGCTGLTSISAAAENENYISQDGVLYRRYEDYDYATGGVVTTYGLTYYPAAKGTSFTIPPLAKYIDNFAFTNCRLKQIDIGSGVTWIDSGAFWDCDNLTSVTIPDNVGEICSWAFDSCDNLCTAYIGTGADYVDIDAFADCPKLAAVYFSGNAPYTESEYFSASALKKYTKSANRFKTALEHAPLELKESCSSLVKTQGIVRAQAAAKLFRSCSSSLTVYRAYGARGYTNPWYGRPVIIFYPTRTCTVKFSLNGKAGDPIADQTVYKYGKAAQPLNPVNPYYRFLGWYKEASCVNKWYFATNTVSSNITLYAKWTNRSVIAAKTNSTYYGTAAGGGTYTDGDPVVLKATPKAGYRFLYWTETIGGTNVRISDQAQISFTAFGSRTVTAQFAAIKKPVITSIGSPVDPPKYSSAVLTWSPVAAASSYKVYRAASSTGTYKMVKDDLAVTNFTDTGLQWGKTYYYKVSAVCAGTTATTEGSKSAYKPFKPTWQKLNLTASSDHNYGVELSWNKIDDADSYKVYRSTSYSGTYSELPGSVTENSYTDSSAELNRTYYYKVRPVDKIEGSADVLGPYSAYKTGKAAWEPITLTAKAKDYQSITLTWNTVTDATTYDVLRCDTYNGEYTAILDATGLTALSYTDVGLTEGKTYYYKLTAHGGAASVTSGYKYAKPAWPKINLKAVPYSYNGIKLSWNEVEGADYYEVSCGYSAYGTYGVIDDVPSGYTSNFIDDGHNIGGFTAGKYYYYKVRPYAETTSGIVYGPYCAYKYAKPAWPAITFKAATNTYNSIKLTWNEVAGATKYDVLRCSTYNGKYTAIPAATGLTTFTYTDTGLTQGKTYYYRLRAYDSKASKTSGYRYAKAAWPALKLKAAANGYNSIILSWNAVNGATRYEILRGTSYTRITTPLESTTSLTFIDSGTAGLAPGKTYYYRVRPVDGDNSENGPYCSYNYAKPVPYAPDVTLSNSATGGIVGTWAAVDSAAGYVVYRATSRYGTYYKLITTAGFSFWDVPLTPGKAYYYKVRAYTYAGTTKVYGAYSAVDYLKG